MGFAATNAIISGETMKMVGLKGNEIILTPLSDALSGVTNYKLEDDLLEMANILSI